MTNFLPDVPYLTVLMFYIYCFCVLVPAFFYSSMKLCCVARSKGRHAMKYRSHRSITIEGHRIDQFEANHNRDKKTNGGFY